MALDSQITQTPKGMLWTGRVISGLIFALFLMAGVMGLKTGPENQKDLEPMGWKVEVMGAIGTIALCSAILYAIPQTAVLGAILLTGYLGGACATHVRVGEYKMAFVPVVVGVLVWLGLFLRDARVRSLAPWRRL